MATWQTAKTNWVSSDYYNFSDANRVENNTEYLKEYFESLGYYADVTTIVSNRTKESLLYAEDVNRIEQNINELREISWAPLGWIEPETDWYSVYKTFDYTDANRLESNLVNLKQMAENIEAAYLKCGDTMTSICGKGNTTF